MVNDWERNDDVIAERFKREEIEGIFKKKFRAKENENLVIEKHGEIYKELGSGEFTVSGLLDKDFTDLLIMDKSEKTLKRTLKNVCLKDEKRMDVHLEIRFKVFHSDRFSGNLVRSRKRLFMEDVWIDILSSLIYKKSLPEIKTHSVKEFLEKDFCEEKKEWVENDMRKVFKDWGLRLTYFSLDFKIPEGETWEETEVKKEEKGEPPKKPEEIVEEGEKGVESGKSKEETIAELEKERVKKEVKMELEEKETQKDMEDAMEAMDLKELKDKQEMLKRAEEKGLGVGEEEEKREDLEKQLKELKEAKEITEKKFYKKELGEEAFQRMMEDFEKKIIEIETKLKSKKG
jgi:hypothetical protein